MNENDKPQKNELHVIYQNLLKVRTITGFVKFTPRDWESSSSSIVVDDKISTVVFQLRRVQEALQSAGYTVQTIRLATNPLEEWLVSSSSSSSDTQQQQLLDERLLQLDACLARHEIDFCALGPAQSIASIQHICPRIVAASSRFSCSAILPAGDTHTAQAAAACIQSIAVAGSNGLGNFRFCVAAATSQPYIPFFPIARAASVTTTAAAANNNSTTRDTESSSIVTFSVGLENGPLAQHLLHQCHSIHRISTFFRDEMARALRPIQTICQQQVADDCQLQWAGIDASLNPSLENNGSVARAMEYLEEVSDCFGGPGTLAAAAAITQALQSLPGIALTGYCGLMLPLCEDTRLADLANQGALQIADLLSISNVCGVGVDTVPIPGNVNQAELASLLLDVAGVAQRWGKSLSCRVFPVPNKIAWESTTFESPYMINSRILPLSRPKQQVSPTT